MSGKNLKKAAWILVPCVALYWVLGVIFKSGPGSSGPDSVQQAKTLSGGNSVSRGQSKKVLSSHSIKDAPGQFAAPDASQERRELFEVAHDPVIEELGWRFRESPDPEERKLAFKDFLSRLTVRNAKAMRAQIAHLSPKSREFSEFHYAWGKIGGSDAVMYGAETKEPDMLITLAGWTSANPDAALDWFNSLEKKNKSYKNQSYLMGGLVHGLTDADPDRAIDFVLNLKDTGQKLPPRLMHYSQGGRMMGIVTDRLLEVQSLADTAAWADSLPEGGFRSAARARVIRDFAREDLVGASAWVEAFSNEPDGISAVQVMAKAWASEDIPNSVTWLETLDGSRGKSEGLSAAYGFWGAKEPESASEYLNNQNDSKERDFAINGFISGLAHKDPENAVLWAAQISNPGLREAAMVRAGHHYFRQDHQAATQWLNGSGLSEGAVKQLINPKGPHGGQKK